MQPYFLPYIGYFQLIDSVDIFIVYDNIKYTKKGWINRNRFLRNGASALFSIPLKDASDFLDVRDRSVAPGIDRERIVNQLQAAYRRAPQFAAGFPLVERAFRNTEDNLFRFIYRSVVEVCGYLGIETTIAISSDLTANHDLRGQERVIALCKCVGADTYVNPIGGTALYSNDEFATNGIELRFLKTRPLEYQQFGAPFVSHLSIVDVMMFNPRELIMEWVAEQYDII